MDGLLSGKLGYVFFVSIADATILSVLALVWFRRSVRALMARRGSVSVALNAVADERSRATGLRAHHPTPKLSFALFESDAARASARAPAMLRQRALRRRLVVAYSLGAGAYALVMTTLQFHAQQPPLPLVAWLARAWVNAWPLVPSLVALLVADRRSMLALAGWYLGLGLVLEFVVTLGGQLLRGTLNAAPATNLYWMLASLLLTIYTPLALIVISAWRRIRSVMPLALAGVLAFGFALLGFGGAMISLLDIERLRVMVLSASAMSSVRVVYYGLFLVLSLPVGWVAWRLLRSIAGGFERKRFSDVQLIVDCWWMLVAAEQASLLATTHAYGAIPGALAAFAAYRVVVAMMLRRPPPEVAVKRLLLLRVFGYQARTESLFDRLAQAWRFDGPVQLIAGTDLASRTATPGSMLRLLSGTLDAQYVANDNDVPARMAQLDVAPDHDGRFRINDVYCRDDTWRSALRALLDTSDCVLMDLRSFSAQNHGCLYELEQLLLRVPTDSIVLIVDRSTDLVLLGATLAQSWERALQAGGGRGTGTLSLVFAQRSSAADLAYINARLHGPGEPDRVVEADALAQAT